MLKLILDLLPLIEYGKNETIDVAKGKYKIPSNWKEFKRTIKDAVNDN